MAVHNGESGERRFILREVNNKGEDIWEGYVPRIEWTSVPTRIGTYPIESLITDHRIHIRIKGRHKQNSEEMKMSLSELNSFNGNMSMTIAAMLMPLLLKLEQEDRVFDHMEGKNA